MKIAVIGTGGVGGYFGGKIAHAGFDVSFLARGEHLSAIKSSGLIINSINGSFRIDSPFATYKIAKIGKSDLVIVAVKAWQVKEISHELSKIIHKNSIILPLQNGVSTIGELKEHLHPNNIIGGLCRIMSQIESPGIIHHSGVTPTIVFGELDNTKTERLQKLIELFNKSGIKAKIAEDIHSELWKKFIAICVSGLLAVTRSTYGEIRELPETRELMIGLINEVYLLSQKIGIKIEPGFIDKTISFIDTFPHDSTSSLTRDVWEGKPSEIEYQNGTVVKLGEKYGIDTPINKFVYNCIFPMELKARERWQMYIDQNEI
jgi:2-dehydropantoate 2-reductase